MKLAVRYSYEFLSISRLFFNALNDFDFKLSLKLKPSNIDSLEMETKIGTYRLPTHRRSAIGNFLHYSFLFW